MGKEVTVGKMLWAMLPTAVSIVVGSLAIYVSMRSTLSVHEVRLNAIEKRFDALDRIDARLQHIDARTIRIEAVLEEQEKQRVEARRK